MSSRNPRVPRVRQALAVILLALAAVAATVALPGSSQASGCTVTWVGDVDGNWFGGTNGANTNWSNDSFPNANDHVCLNNLASAYTVTLSNSALVDHYTIASQAALTINAGVALQAEANSTNAGTITLAGENAELRTEDGDGAEADVETLTNASGGTISIPAGTAGLRMIAGDVENEGTISVAHPEASFRPRAEGRSPKLTNEGTITVANGAALQVFVATLTQASGGAINGQGAVNVVPPGSAGSSRLQISGGSIAATADVNLVDQSIHGSNFLAFVSANGATGNIDVVGHDTILSGSIPAGISIDIETESSLRAPDDVTNAGTIRFNGGNAALAAEDGTGGDDVETLTNASGGTISIPAGGGAGIRVVAGDVDNEGTISVGHAEASFRARAENRSPTLTNSGTLNVANGGVFQVAAATLAQAAGGAISGGGVVNVVPPGSAGSARLRISGGSIAASADVNVLDNSIHGTNFLEFVSAGAATGNIDVIGGDTILSGNVPSGISIDIEAESVLRSPTDFTNAGTIRLNGVNSGLAAEDGTGGAGDVETLTNASGATISIPATGGAGLRVLSGDLVNQGALSVGHGEVTFRPRAEDRPPKLTNSGTLTVPHGGALQVFIATFLQAAGGTITGQGAVNVVPPSHAASSRLQISGGQITGGADVNLMDLSHHGSTFLDFISADGATGNVDVIGNFGEAMLSGNVPDGITVDIEPHSILRSPTSFTNSGTFRLNGAGAELRTENGDTTNTETLTNDGSILFPASVPGSEGRRFVAGDVLNQGAISATEDQVSFVARAENRAPTLTNEGGELDVSADVTATNVTQTAGTTNVTAGDMLTATNLVLQGGTLSGLGTVAAPVTNSAGLVRPGSDGTPGTLSITGPYTQQAGGTLAVRVGGSGNDRLAVSGAATLGGTIATSTVGFTPAVGETYTALTGASRTGEFGTVTGDGFEVAYGATDVKLVAKAPPSPPPTDPGPGPTEPTGPVDSTTPVASIDSPSVQDPGDGRDATLSFMVTLSSAASPGGATVAYSTANGSAIAPGDYEPASGTLTFGPGETAKAVTVAVHGRGAGPDRAFFLNLTNPSGVSIGTGRGVGTIVNSSVGITSITPDALGTGEPGTVTLQGRGFTGNPTFKLVRDGRPDIVATGIEVTGRARTMTGRLDLTNAARGRYHVVVTSQATGATMTLPNGFEVEEQVDPTVVTEIVGQNGVLGDRPWQGLLQYTNLGNVEANNTLLRVDGFHHGANVEVIGRGSSFTRLDGPQDHSVVVAIDRIPARTTGAVLIRFSPLGPAHSVYQLDPWVMRDSESTAAPRPEDPTFDVVTEVLTSTPTSETGVIRVTGPFEPVAIEYSLGFERTSGRVQPTTFTETVEGENVVYEAEHWVTEPAKGPPGSDGTLVSTPKEAARAALFAKLTAPDLHAPKGEFPGKEILATDKAIGKWTGKYKAAKKPFDKALKYKLEAQRLEAFHQFYLSRDRINRCLLNRHLITRDQFYVLQQYAKAGETISLINSLAKQGKSKSPQAAVIAGAFTFEFDIFDAAVGKSWEGTLVGTTWDPHGILWTTLDDEGDPGWRHKIFQGLTPRERMKLVIQLCQKRAHPDLLKRIRDNRLFWLEKFFSMDPNDKIGPRGYGKGRHIPPSDRPMSYTIQFENLATASAPAHDVTITDQLDPKTLDLSTLSLGPVYFADRVATPPPGVQSWTGEVDLRPQKNVIVTIDAHLNRATGLLTWDFSTLDPATRAPTDVVRDGFLPPNASPPAGQGGVTFNVRQQPRLKHGTRISNGATIVFDTNEAIRTPVFTNTIDTRRPSSKIRSVKPRRRSCRALTVRWGGKDRGAGVYYYEVQVARGRGKFQLWRRTRKRAAVYRAARPGTYRFRAIATDGAGHIQRSSRKLVKRVNVRCSAR